jgi:protein-ribulosamine 3-kinase
MRETRSEALQRLINSALGTNQRIAAIRSCSGGCIHQTELITLSDGLELFVKSNRGDETPFVKEAEGLAAIAQTNTLRTPAVVALGALKDDEFCLVLEAITASSKPPNFWSDFGGQLAEMHRCARSNQFGWASDNYLGSTVQSNQLSNNWCQFWADQRLGYQIGLAERSGLATAELQRQVYRVIEKLEQLIGGTSEPASLLHGDLWSGNYLVGRAGEPVLIDPAAYYGHREAELAMPILFGGFPDDFFDAYDSSWPLAAGWRHRVQIYILYHLLNHLNLFGDSYLSSCLQTAQKI